MSEGPKWQGLLKWSLAHADGTTPSRNLSEEDKKWFMEAMQTQTVDVVKRMKEITIVMQTPEQVLEEHGVTSADIEGMLDELQEHVESIDMANDLHSIGGLTPLLSYLKNSHAGVRAKAAEVVTTMVQNNPKSQQLVMEANGLELLMSSFTSDPDVTVQTKALGALASLIRQNKPALVAFRLANGYAALRDALNSEDVKFQRKALNLIQYLLQENRADSDVVSQLGFPRRMMHHLASSEDGIVREAAFRGLLELAKDKTNSSLTEDGEKLKQILKDRIKSISEMGIDDLGAAMEERHLIDSLWTVCFGVPSSLREKGLLTVAGENAPAPDVAGALFEPPLRAFSAANPSTTGEKSGEKRKSTPLLLG